MNLLLQNMKRLIVDNLDSNDSSRPLSARCGKLLKKYIDAQAEDTGWIFIEDKEHSYCMYRARYGFCTVSIESLGGWTIPAKGTKVFEALPDKFRPKRELSTAGTLKGYTGYELQLNIRKDGQIVATNLSPNNSSSYFGAIITYPYA